MKCYWLYQIRFLNWIYCCCCSKSITWGVWEYKLLGRNWDERKTQLEAIGVCSNIHYNHICLLTVSYHHAIFQRISQKEFQEKCMQIFGYNLKWLKCFILGVTDFWKKKSLLLPFFPDVLSPCKISEKSLTWVPRRRHRRLWAQSGVNCPILGSMGVFSKYSPLSLWFNYKDP